MIKPFDILSTRQELSGTGVIYRVSVRSMKDVDGGRAEVTSSLESYILVPPGQDVEAYVFLHLKQAGWLE